MNGSAIKPPALPCDGFIVATQTLLRIVERHAALAPTAEAAEAFVAETERSIDQEKNILRRREKHDPQGVARYMHRRIDIAVAKQEAGDPETAAQVPCARGCNACCYQRVTLSAPEAQQAFAAARRVGHRIDVARARRQLDSDFGPELAHADKRCVMLKDDGDCAIYDERPIACRSYRVIGSAEQCDTEAHPQGGVLAWASPTAEVIASAAMRAYQSGSLSAFAVEQEGRKIDPLPKPSNYGKGRTVY